VGECQSKPLGGLAAGSMGALEDERCKVLIGRIEEGLNGIWVELGVECWARSDAWDASLVEASEEF